MNCKEAETKILFLCEGDLAPSEKEHIQQHLSQCSGCHSLYLQLKEVLQVLNTEKGTEMNPYFTNKTLLKATNKEVFTGTKKSIPLFVAGKKLSYAFVLIVGIVAGIVIGSSLQADALNTNTTDDIQNEFFNADEADILTLK